MRVEKKQIDKWQRGRPPWGQGNAERKGFYTKYKYEENSKEMNRVQDAMWPILDYSLQRILHIS